MFDVIGKRRWFYLASLVLTIPGLVFILLTPFTDAGLQFTIDYTGGTKWEIRFEDPAVTPEQVEAVFAEHGLEASAITTGSGFIEIKTEQIVGLQEAEPSATPVATLAPRPSPGLRQSGIWQSGRVRQPGRVRQSGALCQPEPRAVRVGSPSAWRASASPSPSPSVAPVGQHGAAVDRSARRGPRGARSAAGQDRPAEHAHDDRRGRQLRPHQPGPRPHRRRLDRDHALDHLSLPRRQVRRHGAALAPP